MLENTEQLTQVLGLIAIAVIAAYFGINTIIKNSKSTQAESNIITIMHQELQRMSDQNTKLSLELGRLHDEVINLNRELEKLTLENQRLQIEVVALTNEVSQFKQLAATQKGRRYAAAS
jgi:cell division protein FtsB